MRSSGETTSVWIDTSQVLRKSELQEDIRQADVCIVGAGIAGMTTAYLLTAAGQSVVVLDDGEIGSGETGRTTAHLVNAIDDRYFEIERLHGERGAQLAAESHTRAIDQIEAIVRKERIECDWKRLDGYLFVPPGDDVSILDRELEAVRRAGLDGVERVNRAPLASFDTGPCLRFPRQAQFHPMKYLAGLARPIEQGGGRIYTNTHAETMEGGDQARVKTANGRTITARSLVVATNTPVQNMVIVHTKQAAYRTYVIGVRVPHGSVTEALYWDTADPYHYVRLHRGSDTKDLLIVGGEDHKTGQEDTGGRFKALADWTRERFPEAGEVVYRWSGQIMEPIDSLAFIGRNPRDADNVYIVTGDSGNGMTHGTIAGILLTDLILGRPNEWAALYDPSRITLRATPEFAQENINFAVQYADFVTAGDIESADQLANGAGAIMRRGLRKLAVYRDDQGRVHEFSAACPHLGCVVQWNQTERSWDCPCHGSRFEACGAVMNGPANSGLTPAATMKA